MDMPGELGKTGKAIWAAYEADGLDAGSQSLVRELARCADMLDHLDGLAAARQEAWVTLVFDDMGEIHVSIDKVLELRLKHQTTLKQLYAELRAAGVKAKADPQPGGRPVKDEGPRDMLAELRKQREDRERQLG